MEDRGTGVVVSERLLNVPPKVSPPLVQFLFDELSEAAADKDLDKVRWNGVTNRACAKRCAC